jgi:hypothetical protein
VSKQNSNPRSGKQKSVHVWKVAANILNKQSRRADNVWFSSLGVRRGAKNPSPSKSNVLRNVSKRLGLGLILCLNHAVSKNGCLKSYYTYKFILELKKSIQKFNVVNSLVRSLTLSLSDIIARMFKPLLP